MSKAKLLVYNPKLDALRAFAVGLVIIHHWIPNNKILNILPNGMMGVTLFFVLSGYLITSILYQSKPEGKARTSRFQIIKIFMIRRALKIFPIYYLTLFVLMFFNFEFLNNYWIYFVTYTQNFLFHHLNKWPGEFSHLWTLAIEEQYYLFWPFLVIFTKPKNYLKLLFTIIIVSIVSKIMLNYMFPDSRMNSILLLPSLFAFGVGGLVAFIKLKRIDLHTKKHFYPLSFIVVLAFLSSIYLKYNFIQSELFVLISAVIIYLFTLKNNKLVTTVFTLKPLIFIGKISYGIYLYHNFVIVFYNYLTIKFKDMHIYKAVSIFPGISNPLLRLLWMTFFLFIISISSYYLVEKPINRLKTNFKYKL